MVKQLNILPFSCIFLLAGKKRAKGGGKPGKD